MIASSMFDLPLPFRPVIAVKVQMLRVVLEIDLKFVIVSCFSSMGGNKKDWKMSEGLLTGINCAVKQDSCIKGR
ncbi:hypothetical protein THOM_1503 [Trachipleistophora hominis]|uniref:Uncharacterized protein n=1 Tax=Trachipleistophora hominis TaxID=72359 RepID=L7JW47_TRAHO|nr:hypothetical protein THOM_1503 [Trachipleistophora hominis]